MTVNERLFVAGILDGFGDAARMRDRAALIRLLLSVDVDAPESTANAIIRARNCTAIRLLSPSGGSRRTDRHTVAIRIAARESASRRLEVGRGGPKTPSAAC
jgi:hypothetical protein